MKYLIVLAVFALAFAAEEKEERPKTFRRLIPADVLRGQCTWDFFFNFFSYKTSVL